MSVSQLKDGRWIVQYPNPKKGEKPRLIREYFGRGPTAQLRAEKRNTELNLKETRPKKTAVSGPLFFELAGEYRQNRNRPETAGRAEIHLFNMLTNTILPRIGEIEAIKISHEIMTGYVADRLKTVKHSTVHRELSTIKAILNWAAKRRPPLIPYNPIRDFILSEGPSPVIIPPSSHEVEAILKFASDRLFRAIKMAYYTGLRPGPVELFSLRWESVLWERNVIRIISARKGGPVLRDIPIHPELRVLLEKWWKADGEKAGPIFHFKGKEVRDMTNTWNKAKRKAGITRVLRMYDLRHDFVTTALETGVDIKTLSEIVGSNPETLRRHYQHVSGASRIRAIETIRPPASGNSDGNNL